VSGNRHYSCRITKPAKGSRYAFLLASFAISDAEPSLPSWLGPIEVTPNMAPVVKAYYGRRNTELSLIDSVFRTSAIQQLQRAFPEARLVAPLDPEAEALVKTLVKGERLAAWFREQIGPGRANRQDDVFDGDEVDRELCVRVIGTALIAQSIRGHAETAKYLNDGLPPGTQGLDRHHVLRALRTLQQSWRRSPCADRFLYILMDCDLLNALNVVYEHSRAVPIASKISRRGTGLGHT
jgi:hypothetical protein